MSKTVSFKCEESSTQLFIQILNKLSIAGDRNQTRKIRVGGDEHVFMGGCDKVEDLSIDGKLYSDYTPSEQRDFEILRHAIIAPPPAPVVPQPVSAQPNDGTNDGTTNDGTVVTTPVPHHAPVTLVDDDEDILDSAEAILVRDVVAAKVSQNEMFTAFDVTKLLRQANNQVRHSNIKQIVHALYNHGDMQGYDRSLVRVSNASVMPFLYHPVSADTSTYQG